MLLRRTPACGLASCEEVVNEGQLGSSNSKPTGNLLAEIVRPGFSKILSWLPDTRLQRD